MRTGIGGMLRNFLRRNSTRDMTSPASPGVATVFWLERSEVPTEPQFTAIFPRAPDQVSFVYPVTFVCSECGRTFAENVPFILDEVERPDLWFDAIECGLARFRCPAGHEPPDPINTLLRDSGGRLIFVPGDDVGPREWRSAVAAIVSDLPPGALPDGRIEVSVVRRSELRDVLTALPSGESGPCQPLSELLAETEGNDRARIIALERAASRISKDQQPLEWAQVMFGLGYTRLAMGDVSARSRRALRAAIAVYDANADVGQRALAQHFLGIAAWGAWKASSRPLYEALDEAIYASRAAVSGLDPETERSTWVTSQSTLGTALLARGTDADIEEALGAIGAALQRLPPELEDQRPQIQIDLASALFQHGEDARALEQFDAVARAVGLNPLLSWMQGQLKLLDVAERPLAWAGLAQPLAHGLLATRQVGQRVHNVEQAITLLEGVLRDAPGAAPETLLQAETELAYAYRLRMLGDKGENLRRALEHSQAALERCSREKQPEDWAWAQVQLGMTLRALRPFGESDLNLARAIAAFEAAWANSAAMTAAARLDCGAELAMAYWQRGRTGDLDRAIALLADVVEQAERDAPESWPGWCGNLATLRVARNEDGDAAAAIAGLNTALGVLAKRAWPDDASANDRDAPLAGQPPPGWAWANPARAGDLPAEVMEAAYAYAARTGAARPGEMPAGGMKAVVAQRDWATLQALLGHAWESRRDGDRQVNIEEAIQAGRAALKVFTAERFPQPCWVAAGNLARVLIEAKRWEEAYNALETAIRAADADYLSAVTDQTKGVAAGQIAHIYCSMVDVCLHLDSRPHAEALRWAEEGRSRVLRDQLAAIEIPPPPGHEADPRFGRERHLLAQLRELQQQQESGSPEIRRPLVDEQANVRQELRELWEEFESDAETAGYVALRRGERFEWSEFRAWLDRQGPRVALLEYFTLEDSLVAFLALPTKAEPAVYPVKLSPHDVDMLRKQCEREVYRYDPEWPLEETWQGLAAPLVAPVLPALAGVDLLYIVPHGSLHGVPLHAIAVDGRTLLDETAVAYAPSAIVARRLTGAPSQEETTKALVVGNPTGDLEHAEDEANAIGRWFGVEPIVGPKARVETVASSLKHAQIAHFACHAFFDLADPFSSGLELADGVLTAHDIQRDQISASRIILSACETAMVEAREGDELFGLSRAFIYCGVPTLVATMWGVDDPATQGIMLAFYNGWHAQNPQSRPGRPAQALREAMLQARDAGAHTHLWAPFIMIGNPF
jgi:CHAT domain-containing protein/tetratricopeptide (TPR) repeat protein